MSFAARCAAKPASISRTEHGLTTSRDGKHAHPSNIRSLLLSGLSGNGMDMTTVATDGTFKRSRVFKRPDEQFSEQTSTTWLPRDGLNAALYQHVCDHYSDAVTVQFSTKVVDILVPQAPGQPLGVVTASCGEGGGDEARQQLNCKLMVGADGANSCVREALERSQPGQGWHREEKASASSGLLFRVRTNAAHSCSDRLACRTFRIQARVLRRECTISGSGTYCPAGSTATGSQRCCTLQVLPLPPCPKLCDSAGVLQNDQAAAFAGHPVNGDAPLRLGLLPFADNTRPRTANFILWPDHNFWKIKEPAELYAYLQKAFPQVQYWRELVPEAEAKRFLSTEPGQFSPPQACAKMLACFEDAQEVATREGDAASTVRGSAVMLLGDAAHVFPPGAFYVRPYAVRRMYAWNTRGLVWIVVCQLARYGSASSYFRALADLGQGVNSAILDVYTLCTCLERHSGDSSAALLEYEAIRVPESKALRDIMVARSAHPSSCIMRCAAHVPSEFLRLRRIRAPLQPAGDGLWLGIILRIAP